MDPFVAEIRIFGFNFPPTGWAFCDGQILSISQNTALFSLIGTYYGGDGRTTFRLPDMQGNAPVNPGQGPGLANYDLGEMGGSETVTLLQGQLPAHTHTLQALGVAGNRTSPIGNTIARVTSGNPFLPPAGATTALMALQTVNLTGGDQPHQNMMPYLTMNFCIAMQGIYPPRN